MSIKDMVQTRIVRLRHEDEKRTENQIVSNLTSYFQNWGIKSVVIGMSGGIDSAYTFELLRAVQEECKLQIHTVFFKHNLHENEADGEIVREYVDGKSIHHEYDLSPMISAAISADGDDSIVTNTQFAYALMYTMLFRVAQSTGSITVGTTNRDEFKIGWFGKTSDMVVDIQPIIRMSKMGIYNSEYTKNIPSSITGRAPNGDLYTGLSDEEVFGCSYEEVGAIISLLAMNEINYTHLSENYPKLHTVLVKNAHKLGDYCTYNPIFM